jgi:hypothetical protein
MMLNKYREYLTDFELFFLNINDVDETLLKKTSCSSEEFCYADDNINAMFGAYIAGRKAQADRVARLERQLEKAFCVIRVFEETFREELKTTTPAICPGRFGMGCDMLNCHLRECSGCLVKSIKKVKK